MTWTSEVNLATHNHIDANTPQDLIDTKTHIIWRPRSTSLKLRNPKWSSEEKQRRLISGRAKLRRWNFTSSKLLSIGSLDGLVSVELIYNFSFFFKDHGIAKDTLSWLPITMDLSRKNHNLCFKV